MDREHGGGRDRRGKLYVVATPIGNLADITLRALEILRTADTVFAEDTRDAQRLLAHHAITARLAALHEHNEREATAAILALLAQGRDVALVTDAGTPGISDPGAFAVAEARAAGFAAVPIPGPSAVTAALSAGGLPGPFAFVGFLPTKPAARVKAIEAWRTFPHTLVFYEAPHRIVECIVDLTQVLGPDRTVVIARELTKMFEQISTGRLGAAKAWLAVDENRQRGEFVVLVSGAGSAQDERAAEGERVLTLLLDELPVKSAVRLATAITGAPRNALYAQALAKRQSAEPRKREAAKKSGKRLRKV
jgi:16S rRNA (cytidine1402-2'-O)-methyltransferase